MQLISKSGDRNYTDEEIITGIKQKDRKILSFVYKSHFGSIARYVRQNSGDDDDAKDVFHESFTAVYEGCLKNKVILKSSFKTYFFSVCKNKWLMVLRRRKTAKKINEQIVSSAEISEDHSEMLHDHLRYKLYRKYFEQLPEDCREVMSKFLSGNSLKEIALAFGFTEAYAKKKKHNCQKKLINSIESDGMYQELKWL